MTDTVPFVPVGIDIHFSLFPVQAPFSSQVIELRTQPGPEQAGFLVGQAYSEKDAEFFCAAPDMLRILRQVTHWRSQMTASRCPTTQAHQRSKCPWCEAQAILDKFWMGK